MALNVVLVNIRRNGGAHQLLRRAGPDAARMSANAMHRARCQGGNFSRSAQSQLD
jgi:hypothetical protein